ncbi:MAG: oligoendopeptidase F, partial [Clostridia bacterium]
MSDKILERSEIDEKYKWHLNDIFESDSAWEKEYAKIPKIAVKLSGFAGKLGTASALYECLTCADELSDALLAVLAYARMRRDEDNSNAIYQGMTDCAARLMSECAAQSAFITPEILALGDARVEDMMKECSELAVYSHMLYNVFRESAHTLSERE